MRDMRPAIFETTSKVGNRRIPLYYVHEQLIRSILVPLYALASLDMIPIQVSRLYWWFYQRESNKPIRN